MKLQGFFMLIPSLLLAMPILSQAKSISQVEVQWSICEASEAQFFQKINRRPSGTSFRDVLYSETSNLDLAQRGAMFRTRVPRDNPAGPAGGNKNDGPKTAAKVRGLSEVSIPWKFLEGKDSKCELDAYAATQSIGCSLYFKPGSRAQLRSADQELFIANLTGFRNFSALIVLGPAHSIEWTWDEASVNESLVMEALRTQKGFFSLELSTRVDIDKQLQVYQKITTWLNSRLVQLCPQQGGKTTELLRSLLN